jgi:hypothetical protein
MIGVECYNLIIQAIGIQPSYCVFILAILLSELSKVINTLPGNKMRCIMSHPDAGTNKYARNRISRQSGRGTK